MAFALMKKSANWFGALFLVVTIAPLHNVALAAEQSVITTEVGISALRFKYDEVKNIDGSILDTEQGGLPGVVIESWHATLILDIGNRCQLSSGSSGLHGANQFGLALQHPY